MLEQKLISIMKSNEQLLEDLDLVRQLNLPHWWIAAGYVRNYVWDNLHDTTTELNDVDVIYYDREHLSEAYEKELTSQLKQAKPAYCWSIKNQARMHIQANDPQYESVEDAVKRWPETATAVGITMDTEGQLHILAPHGLDDLFQLVIRKSPFFKDEAYYIQRVCNKRWLSIWNKLSLRFYNEELE